MSFFLFLFFLTFHYTQCIRFNLKPGSTKCLRHDSPKGVITNGMYHAEPMLHQRTDIIVKDNKGHLLYKRENINNGTFAFSTEDYDLIEVCFAVTPESNVQLLADHEIMLDIKQGAEAKDYDMLAKAEKLKPMEAELKKLEALTGEILNDFNLMHSRSEEMRQTNQSTHSRVLYFSVLSMLILVGFACWQILYLRRYFKSKKLIE